MYGEVIIAMNIWMSIMILFFVNQIGRFHCSKKKIIFISIITGLPTAFFPATLISNFFLLLIQLLLSFGTSWRKLSTATMLSLTGALLAGGLLTALQTNMTLYFPKKLIIAGIFLLSFSYYAVSYMFKMKNKQFSHEIIFQNEIIKAFIDTGNHCTEPISGQPVHFLSKQVAEKIYSDEILNALQKVDGKKFPQLNNLPEQYQKKSRAIALQTVNNSIAWCVGLKITNALFLNDRNIVINGYVVIVEDSSHFPENAQILLHASCLMDAPTYARGNNTKIEGGVV